VPTAIAHQIGNLPPVSSLFAAVLGVNRVQHLLSAARVLAGLPAVSQRVLTGRTFFPELISQPFHHGLVVVLSVSAALAAVAPSPRCCVAAATSPRTLSRQLC